MIEVVNLIVRQSAFTLPVMNFRIETGCYAVLMGPTGSGKTTLLEAIAGLRPVASGMVKLRGQDVTHTTPAGRNLGYVPQDAAVFRTMTVRDNLAFGLALRGASDVAIVERVQELAKWLGLLAILDRKAIRLSGGEAQRVALGRALAFRPDVLLLDEPLNAVDSATHDELIERLRELRKREAITAIHVTHSQTEADQLGEVVLRIG